ncbi:nuclear transport factor 2 family protein [Stenotrophomonas sp. NA06056]|uniref:nuclear transport factor 2 family protein n=1 Tax=Stenotrophomonas sp. NA06056 TaxID=2742129 RepID=UPI00158DF9CB|nr:nuclear transport factor 2 family protein [Stenotrophomonas sp. NA06056]QKW56774.1 nuclear transport factor 2 family protein [Stenotrophomonas sp. NA06056]
MDTEVRQLEETLRVAMLSSDVATLDALIADALIFVGPSGEVFGKQDDLALHRSGRQKLSMAEWRSVDIVMHDQTAVALTTADLAGTFDGAAFSGRFRYCRFWGKKGGVWQVLGGSVLALPAAKEAIAQLP